MTGGRFRCAGDISLQPAGRRFRSVPAATPQLSTATPKPTRSPASGGPRIAARPSPRRAPTARFAGSSAPQGTARASRRGCRRRGGCRRPPTGCRCRTARTRHRCAYGRCGRPRATARLVALVPQTCRHRIGVAEQQRTGPDRCLVLQALPLGRDAYKILGGPELVRTRLLLHHRVVTAVLADSMRRMAPRQFVDVRRFPVDSAPTTQTRTVRPPCTIGCSSDQHATGSDRTAQPLHSDVQRDRTPADAAIVDEHRRLLGEESALRERRRSEHVRERTKSTAHQTNA